MPKETIATSVVHDEGEPHTNILKVAWGAKGAHPEAPDGWVNAGFAHLYIGTKDEPFLGTVELGEDEIDHLIRVLKRVKRQAFRSPAVVVTSAPPNVTIHYNGTDVTPQVLTSAISRAAKQAGRLAI